MKQENVWSFCDGDGNTEKPAPRRALTRRQVVQGGLTAALTAWLGRSALTDVAFAAPGGESGRDILVVLFLRGAADGLSLVAPYGDDSYYRLRPTLGLAKPAGKKQSGGGRLSDLNGFFGLHPSLSGLYPYYEQGSMAAIHAIGSFDRSRSHFEAMMTMERGAPDQKGGASSGWLARYLTAVPPVNPANLTPLRAVAFGSITPDSLRGATEVTTINSLLDYKLELPKVGDKAPVKPKADVKTALAALYGKGDDAVTRSGRATLTVLDTLHRADPANYKPKNGANYPQSDLGNGMRQVAFLLRQNLGLEVACLDRGGWDTHVGQGGSVGWLALQLQDVGDSLAAFAKDLGSDGMRRVTVLVMTEFGRRAQENSGLGTDHGRASAMFLLGGGVNGGKVYGKWPGLKPENMEDGMDLKVTTDYRTVLAEVLAKRLGGASKLPAIFPDGGLQAPLGVAKTV